MRFSHLLCLFSLASLLVGCSSKPAVEPIWIAQLLPLEGPRRIGGRHAQQGAAQAVEEAHEAGEVVNGRPFAVLHVESRDDPAAVAAETVRVLTVNKAAALVADFETPQTERLIRESRSYGVPVIVPGELPGPADAETTIALGVPPTVRGRVLARHACGELHLKRAAVLTDSRRPVAAALAAAFVKNWPRDGIVEEWTFTTAAERDERIARMIQAAPAVVLLACSPEDFRAVRPRLADNLPKVPLLYGGEDAGVYPLQAELESRAEVYLATAYSAENLSEIGRSFARHYNERFHEPPDLHAAQSYDAVRLLLDVLRRAGTANKDTLLKELANLEQFESVTGLVRWKDHQPQRRVFLTVLRDNRPKVVSITEPAEN